MTTPFVPLPPAADAGEGRVGGPLPVVLRGMAAGWPAVQAWDFARLARLAPDLAVQLVSGNRERDATRFVTGTLGDYLRDLEQPASGPPLYLKEFDLLARFPHLRADLRPEEVFPPRTIRSSSAWIGPATARTGLHCDLLDNLAVQVIGTKRFLLAPPGTVEAHRARSAKYDAWAHLAAVDIDGLAALVQAGPDRDRARLLAVDLFPGDVLYVPRLWWHQVENLSASVLLSGFFGAPSQVVPRWAAVTTRHLLHRAGITGRRGCTCHPARADPDPVIGQDAGLHPGCRPVVQRAPSAAETSARVR